MKNNILIIALLGMMCLLACKKKSDSPKPAETVVIPTPSTPAVVQQPKVVFRKDIKLYNQYSASDKKYYRIADSTYYSNRDDSQYDFAFVYVGNTDTEWVGPYKYAIGCSGAPREQFTKPTNRSTYEVRFYNLATINSVAFDTLMFSSTVAKMITKYGSPVTDLDIDAWFPSDEFGWAVGTLFGFKLPNGKYGIAKITKQPTGNGAVGVDLDSRAGSVSFDFKMER
jgi:hypothetical protein